jgi:RNA polymerase subunit RPABC4/transcription elongation factor Spt4
MKWICTKCGYTTEKELKKCPKCGNDKWTEEKNPPVMHRKIPVFKSRR